MTSEQAPTPLTARITTHLPLVEKILLTTLLIGVILTIMQIDSTVTRGSLLGLAVTFFLLAYRPIDVPRQENELPGFSELLGLAIVPKVLWISSAISALGIAFYIFNFGNPGYKNMLMDWWADHLHWDISTCCFIGKRSQTYKISDTNTT